jgi:hypothetical protein
MKFKLLTLFLLLSFHTFAEVINNQEPEIVIEESSALEISNIRIKDVKELIENLGAENTCMDEYLKRRGQLVTKLALTPVILPVGFYAATFGAGFGGAYFAYLVGFDPLGGVILGMFTGAVGSSAGLLTDTGFGIAQFVEVDRIVKSLAELHLNQPAQKTTRLFEKYAKNNENAVDQKSFEIQLLALDQEGKLCDGSLTKSRSGKVARRLKKKIARTKHLKDAI